MNAIAVPFTPKGRHPRLEWLRRELAPFPGRDTATIRLVVSAVLVVIISMTLRVPEALVSAYMVFFVTKENKAVTTLMGVMIIIGATIAIALSLILYRFTFDLPEFRIPLMAVVLFAGFYLSRILNLGPLTFGMAFVISGTQSLVEVMPNEEYAVHWVLWLWVAVAYPIVITIIVNHFLLPAHPHTALVRELQNRLDAVTVVIKQKLGWFVPSKKVTAALQKLGTRDSSTLFKLLAFAEDEDPRLKRQHGGQSVAIMATERLVTAAAAFTLRKGEPLSPKDIRCLETLLAEAALLRRALQQPSFGLPPKEADVAEATLPEIRKLQHAMAALRDSLEGEIIESSEPLRSPKRRKRLWSEDAFTNPAHVYYALKVTLAAMTCYILYTAVDWPGIHTAFITCCFISLENTGSTIRKGMLRIGGCLIGGLLGFLSILYLIPHMESITSLALLVAAVCTIAGWVASGSERIAYAGLQIALAFFMCVLQTFEPDTDLTRIRDRVVGILLGIVVTTLVFRYIWPEHAADRLRKTLSRTLRNLARLLTIPKPQTSLEAAAEEAQSLRSEITGNLYGMLRLAESASFEDEDTGIMEAIATRADGVFLTETLLAGETGLVEWRRESETVQNAESLLRNAAAAQVERIASSVESGTSIEQIDLAAPLASCLSLTGSTHRSALLLRLVEQIQQLT